MGLSIGGDLFIITAYCKMYFFYHNLQIEHYIVGDFSCPLTIPTIA